MPKGRGLPIEGSWVVEGEDKGSGYSPENNIKEDESPIRATPGRPKKSSGRPSRANDRSPDPEFIMPSMTDSVESSLREARSTRMGSKSAEKGEARRRSTRQVISNGSPEKRHNPKVTSDKVFPATEASQTASRHSIGNTNSFQEFIDSCFTTGIGILTWLFDVLGGALHVIKTPLSYLVAIWFLFGIAVIARNLITISVYASLSPICRVPGASLLNLPFCPIHKVDTQHGEPPPVEFDQLMAVQSKFEEVLEESASGVSLPLDMKRGEASIRDLRQLVRYSQLHSKNELVLEFDGFIDNARIASYDLQRFNSHVGRAVDSVISTTRWTTKVLDGIQERDASRGSVNAFINDKLLAPFQPVRFTESVLLDQYIQHTRLVEEEIHKLISEAQALLMVLNNLEDRLEVIHGITTRDDMHAKAMKEEILAELWTMVGGNRGKLNKMDRQLSLLKQVSIYRKTAYAHVSGTIIRLQAMGAGLEDLRERVGSPELLRDRRDIPLSVHIENIQRGVERLEEGRLNAKRSENEVIKQTLERGQLLEGSSLIEA